MRQLDQHAPDYVRAVRRVTWAGLIANVLLAALKIAGGVLGGSQAVVADAVHTVSDMGTDLAVLIGVRYWSAPADDRHPHGHARIETLITVAIGLFLALVGVGLAWRALATWPQAHGRAPGALALTAALVSIVTKETVYRWTARVGLRYKSPAVVANAWHHRSDALSSVPAAAAVGIAMLRPEWYFVDHVGAVVVSVFILQAAWQLGWPALRELVDAGAPREVLARIEQLAREVDGVRGVHRVRTRYVGSALSVDLHVLVDGAVSVRDGHEIAERVTEHVTQKGPDVVDIVVHLEPSE